MLRRTNSDRSKPLIFIAHSLGGIVVKDALSLSRYDLTHLRDIESTTTGVIFLGTPHYGSQMASLGMRAFELSRLFVKSPNLEILRGLEENSEILERIARAFGQVLAKGQLKVHSFREELNTNGIRIVGSHSSSIGYLYETSSTLHANHRTMAKMTSLQDIKFRQIVSVIQRWLDLLLEEQTAQRPVEFGHDLPDGLIFDNHYHHCMRSLNFAVARSRIENIEEAFEGTYDWLFDPQLKFTDWLSGLIQNPIYWIQGKPGSGKSTLMKLAMRHPTTREFLRKFHDAPWIIAAYFFHDRGVDIQKSISGFLHEVLYQILLQQKLLFPVVYSIFRQFNVAEPQEHHMGGGQEDDDDQLIDPSRVRWSLSRLQDALLSIGNNAAFDVNICIFIDALDEHDGDHRDLLATLEKLTRAVNNEFFRLRLCMAGRQENVFKDAFRDCPGFAIHDWTTNDIRTYTEGRIQKGIIDILTNDGEIALSSLIEDIIDRAEGVFLWVRLVTNELAEGFCEGDSIGELKELLSAIPTELEELYTRTLRRRSRNQHRFSAKNKYERYIMFQIVKCARKPFSLYDLLAASIYLATGRGTDSDLHWLSNDQMYRRLYNRSAGLLDAPRLSPAQEHQSEVMPPQKSLFAHASQLYLNISLLCNWIANIRTSNFQADQS